MRLLERESGDWEVVPEPIARWCNVQTAGSDFEVFTNINLTQDLSNTSYCSSSEEQDPAVVLVGAADLNWTGGLQLYLERSCCLHWLLRATCSCGDRWLCSVFLRHVDFYFYFFVFRDRMCSTMLQNVVSLAKFRRFA